MPNKSIYVRDEDAPLFEKAQEISGESLSVLITRALRQFVDAEAARGELQRAEERIEKLAHELISRAASLRATDIHIEPARGEGRLRLRIDGSLQTVQGIPEAIYEAFLTWILERAVLEADAPAEYPQGHLNITVAGERHSFRLAATPSLLGRALTLRRLPSESQVPKLEDFEPEGQHAAQLRNLLSRGHGLIVATGPSGCGKTSTLYALLSGLDREKNKVVIVQDSTEYVLDGCLQIPASNSKPTGYAEALRAAMQADPDAIFVGEIRDAEITRRCAELAVTGHLVLTQLHAPTAASAIRRFLDLGIPPFLLRDALHGVIAQRLLRKLCDHCKSREKTSKSKLSWLAEGCQRCDGLGTRGRTAIFEIATRSAALDELIIQGASEADLDKALRDEGIPSLFDDAIQKAEAGHIRRSDALGLQQ